MTSPDLRRPTDSWAPLRHPVFRLVWLAAFVANIGTWMQTVAGQWLLIEQHSSSLLISLVQSASSLPVLLLVIPAGVVADFLDRRRLLLIVQGVQAATAGLLALLTVAGRTSPEVLLLFTFLLGCGAAAQLPALQAILADLLPRAELGPGASLSSLSVNLARAVGPAFAGLLLAHLGVAWLFGLNAISFLLFGAALLLTPVARTATARDVRVASWSSFEAGGRYVVHAPVVRRILVRLVLFAWPANVLWALLAPLAERRLGLGAGGYGILLGAAGAGAVAGALVLPLVRDRLTPSRQLTISGTVYGAGLIGLAAARNLIEAIAILVPVGVAWIAVIAGLNATTQTFLPDWVRARALAVYQMVLFATFAGSAATWGAVANWFGLVNTFAGAGILLMVTTAIGLWLPLWRTDIGDRVAVPPNQLPQATFSDVSEPDSRVEIVNRYHVLPAHRREFLQSIGDLRMSRLRTGATHWLLLSDAADPEQLIERYQVASWAEYLDQHRHRQTAFDEQVRRRVESIAETVEQQRLVDVTVPHLHRSPHQHTGDPA